MTVAKVYPEVVNGTFKADLAITGTIPEKPRVGQTYPVDILLGSPSKAIMIDKGTFFQSSGGKYVYVMDPDGKSAHKREVTLGRRNPKYYEVLEGLSPGEKVIISSYTDFGEADKIKINN